MKIPVTCSYCSKTVLKWPYQIERCKHGLFFCSYTCQRAYRKAQMVLSICSICGKEFYAKPYRLKKLVRAQSITCSYKCKSVILGWGSQSLTCDWCGKPLKRKNASLNVHNFCSRKCMGRWQSAYKVGENSNTWRGGYEQYYGPNWERQRRKARHRDNKTCQCCGLREQDADHTLEVHHLKPFRDCKDYKQANTLTNLITLCRDCHVAADVVSRRLFDDNWTEAQVCESLNDYSAVFGLYFDETGLAP